MPRRKPITPYTPGPVATAVGKVVRRVVDQVKTDYASSKAWRDSQKNPPPPAKLTPGNASGSISSVPEYGHPVKAPRVRRRRSSY